MVLALNAATHYCNDSSNKKDDRQHSYSLDLLWNAASQPAAVVSLFSHYREKLFNILSNNFWQQFVLQSTEGNITIISFGDIIAIFEIVR